MEGNETSWNIEYRKHIGQSHEKNKLPCQDDVFGILKNGVSVIALSDGCGSSELAETGARLTIETITNLMVEEFDRIAAMTPEVARRYIGSAILKAMDQNIAENRADYETAIDPGKAKHNSYFDEIENLRKSLDTLNDKGEPVFVMSEEAKKRCLFLSRLNSTLLFVACKNNVALVGHFGDGWIGAMSNSGKYQLISEEPKKQGEENYTYYVESLPIFEAVGENIDAIFRYSKIDDISNVISFFLTSDGGSLLVREGDGTSRSVARLNIGKWMLAVSKLEAKDRSALMDEAIQRMYERSDTFDDTSLAIMSKPHSPIEVGTLKNYLTEEAKPKEAILATPALPKDEASLPKEKKLAIFIVRKLAKIGISASPESLVEEPKGPSTEKKEK